MCAFYARSRPRAAVRGLPIRSASRRRELVVVVANHAACGALHRWLAAGAAPAPTAARVFDVVVAAPVLEEILFRGAVLGALRARATAAPAACVLAQAALFGAFHGANASSRPAAVVAAQALGAVVAGGAYGAVVLAGGALADAVLLHAANNAFALCVFGSDGLDALGPRALPPLLWGLALYATLLRTNLAAAADVARRPGI